MVTKKKENFSIIPFNPEHGQALLDLERMLPQGTMVKLETVRDNFLSRASVFDDYEAYVVLGHNKKPVAGGIGACVPIIINDTPLDAGFGFDVMVNPNFRNLGIGEKISGHIREHFFKPRHLAPQFTILKSGNHPMLKQLSRAYRATFQYEFLYLTFPTAKSIRVESAETQPTRFGVELLSRQEELTDYYDLTESGLGLWYTYKFYELKVKSVSPVLSGGLKLGNRLIRINKYVPLTGSIIKTVTVFNLDHTNIHTLPSVAFELYKQGINYLQICCQPNDAVYNALYKSALSAYSHYVVSTQEIKASEELILDVRCL
jgi:hypothetical protein